MLIQSSDPFLNEALLPIHMEMELRYLNGKNFAKFVLYDSRVSRDIEDYFKSEDLNVTANRELCVDQKDPDKRKVFVNILTVSWDSNTNYFSE